MKIDIVEAAFAVACAALLFLAVAATVGMYIDWREWPAYRDAHHCTPTGAKREETTLQPVITGKMNVLVPITSVEKEWNCDNGVVWR